jgi:uncharacterized protein (TIGR02453 family)
LDRRILRLFHADQAEYEETMATHLNLGPILSFLDELSQNNNKTWFDGHRPDYEAARNSFEQFIDILIDEFRVSDHLQGLSAKECMARIYRDIRFSKDKSPYKTNLTAIIAPGGWKTSLFGYYVSLEPHTRSMAAGGLHSPTPEQLTRFRQDIVQDASEFKRLTSARDFVEAFGAVEGERLKTAPKGYDPAHPEIALLQLKQVTVLHRFSDPEVLASNFASRVITVCRAMRPFLGYLSEITQ